MAGLRQSLKLHQAVLLNLKLTRNNEAFLIIHPLDFLLIYRSGYRVVCSCLAKEEFINQIFNNVGLHNAVRPCRLDDPDNSFTRFDMFLERRLCSQLSIFWSQRGSWIQFLHEQRNKGGMSLTADCFQKKRLQFGKNRRDVPRIPSITAAANECVETLNFGIHPDKPA